jgi:hypothetical protein
MTIPAIFVEESSADETEVARVGTITQAAVADRYIALEYVYDPLVPKISNMFLKNVASELAIGQWELTTTHWAVKDVDLFRVLLRNLPPTRPQPKVFRLAAPENVELSLVSAMMPFESSFDAVNSTLRRAAESLGFRFRRADDIWENPAVIQDVVSLIDHSSVVICDCTGRNPNVFYEAGIAHTLGREVILITQADADIPFDLRHLRYVKYLNNSEGLAALAGKLTPRLEALAP